jgi:chromosomal replication initiator protein
LELPAQLELVPAWRQIRAEMQRAVGDSVYDIWLASLEAKGWDGNVLLLDAPAATKDWVSGRYRRIVEACAKSVIGPGATIAFADDAAAAPTPSPGARLDLDLPFNPRYNFSQFIIGDSNRLAHAGALSAAELPGQAFNPLFLYAPPGLGKTHLLHAIGNYVLAFGGGATVRYTTVEAFTNHFISALAARSLDNFKQAYRDADVLLIDDVQFLVSKAKTEEEFFHTFNSVYETGRQLVLTCDRLPQHLVGIEERLRERFQSGLVAEIKPPDRATRVAILRKRVALDNIELEDPAVLGLVADRITTNVRTLEGALIRIVAHHSLTAQPIDLELATSVLDDIAPARGTRETTIDSIQRAVSNYYSVPLAELLSASRAARVAWPRQVAIHLSRRLTKASLQEIGTAFGGRNHATVLHACKRVDERLHEDLDASRSVDDLLDSLSSPQPDRKS